MIPVISETGHRRFFPRPSRFAAWTLLAAPLLLAVFFSFRCYQYEPRIWMDEGMYLQIAKNLAEVGRYGLQTAPVEFAPIAIVSVGYPVLAPAALSMAMFGTTMGAARLPFVFVIIATIAAAFFLVRRMSGPRTAFVAAGLLALFNPLYANGKIVNGEGSAILLFLLSLIFIERLQNSGWRDRRAAFWGGIFLGAAASAKPIFLLMPLAAGITILILWRRVRPSPRVILAAAAGALIPVAVWVATQIGVNPETYRELWAHYTNVYGERVDTGALIRSNARLLFTDGSPLYLVLLLLLAAVSGAIRFRRKNLRFAEVAVPVYAVLAILNFLRLEPWYRYLYPAQVLLIILLPSSILFIRDALAERFSRRGPWTALPVAVLLSAAALHSVVLVQRNTNACAPEGTHVLEEAARSLPADGSVYFLDSPDVAFFMPHRNFHQFINVTRRFSVGNDELRAIREGHAGRVVIRKSFEERDATDLVCYQRERDLGNFVVYVNSGVCAHP